jgi:hypothetical protein
MKMTHSVEDLRRESERNRAELTASVDRLKQGITDTTQDIRKMVSPQHIKSEVSGYVSDKAQSLIDGLKQQAIENPMRAANGTWGTPAASHDRGRPCFDVEDRARPGCKRGRALSGQG